MYDKNFLLWQVTNEKALVGTWLGGAWMFIMYMQF